MSGEWPNGMEVLEPHECWALVREADMDRLATGRRFVVVGREPRDPALRSAHE